MSKIVKVSDSGLELDCGTRIYDYHPQDCCEQHYLDWSAVDPSDLVGKEIHLDDFFERVDGYGIRIKVVGDHPVAVAGYGDNNGYYSSEILLVVDKPGLTPVEYDISECQEDRG